MDKNQRKASGFKKFLAGKYTKILLILFFDIGFAVASFCFARLIFFADTPLDGPYARYRVFEYAVAGVLVLLTVAMLIFFDCYNSVWRYAGRVAFFKVFLAYFTALASSLLLAGVLRIPYFNIRVPITMVLAYSMFSFTLSAGMRFNYGIRNYVRHLSVRNRSLKRGASVGRVALRTVVIGAGYTGTAFVNRLVNNPEDGYFPIAFIDDDPEKHNKKIHGVPVTGGRQKLSETVERFRAQAIVIAVTSLTKPELKELFFTCSAFNLPVKILSDLIDPGPGELTHQTLTLRDIKIEELLGREEFKVNKTLLDGAVKDKTVLVTGGAGSIGSELCRQALEFGCTHLIIFDNHENGMFEIGEEFKEKYDTQKYSLIIGSVREKQKLEEVFLHFKPDIVFHAAAYKHVPMMEHSAAEAVKNNVFGTLNVIRAAEKAGCARFIFISTDKAVNPANVMGASKRIAELAVQEIGKTSKMHMAAVRFGNVLGSNGSVIPIFLRQIKDGGPITLTHRDIRRYFMTIPEAVRLVLQAGSLAKGGEIFVLDMGEPVLIYDLACTLCRINGLIPEKDIEIRETGLRPGEKMFEELNYDQESVDITAHEGIFVTKPEKPNVQSFRESLVQLEKTALSEDNQKTAEFIFKIVPNLYREQA